MKGGEADVVRPCSKDTTKGGEKYGSWIFQKTVCAE